MAQPRVTKGRITEGTDNFSKERVVKATSTGDQVILQSDVSGTITLNIFHLNSSTPNTAIYTITTIPVTSVSDTLLAWTLDGTGYNFAYEVKVSDLAPVVLEGGNTYKLEYSFPRTSNAPIKVAQIWEVESRGDS